MAACANPGFMWFLTSVSYIRETAEEFLFSLRGPRPILYHADSQQIIESFRLEGTWQSLQFLLKAESALNVRPVC